MMANTITSGLVARCRPSHPKVALAVVSGLATALALPWLPPGLPILLAALLGVVWGWWVPAPPPAADPEGAT